jgi:hypothetical protein
MLHLFAKCLKFDLGTCYAFIQLHCKSGQWHFVKNNVPPIFACECEEIDCYKSDGWNLSVILLFYKNFGSYHLMFEAWCFVKGMVVFFWWEFRCYPIFTCEHDKIDGHNSDIWKPHKNFGCYVWGAILFERNDPWCCFG